MNKIIFKYFDSTIEAKTNNEHLFDLQRLACCINEYNGLIQTISKNIGLYGMLVASEEFLTVNNTFLLFGNITAEEEQYKKLIEEILYYLEKQEEESLFFKMIQARFKFDKVQQTDTSDQISYT